MTFKLEILIHIPFNLFEYLRLPTEVITFGVFPSHIYLKMLKSMDHLHDMISKKQEQIGLQTA